MDTKKGFTLIEMMIVISIMGIFATMALPQYGIYQSRNKMDEAIALSELVQQRITNHYQENQSFPENNSIANLPSPEQLIGNYVERIEVFEGAIHIQVGNKIGGIFQGKIVSLRPAVVSGSPTSPISWLCGYDAPVAGMTAIGENKTSLPREFLPARCRGLNSSQAVQAEESGGS